MSLTTKDYIVTIITVLLILLFGYTGFTKVLDYSLFKQSIAESPLLVSFSKYLAFIIPWIEFAVLLLLAVPRYRLLGFYASFILMTIFTVYVLAIVLFNDKLPCSCGGIMQELTWQQHILVNSVFTALSFLGIILQKQLIKAQRKVKPRIPVVISGEIQ